MTISPLWFLAKALAGTLLLVLAAGGMVPTQITIFLLSLAMLLGLARVLGEIARQLKQPAVLGEILAGVVLGPTVLGALSPLLQPVLGVDTYQTLFPDEGTARTALDGFILISATLLLLVVGIEVDLSTVWRQGKAMVLVSACGIGVPFCIGFSLAWFFPWMLGVDPGGGHRLPFAIFLGIALSITALPVIAKILMDLNLDKSDLGVLVISSAMLNDVVGWIGFAVVLALLGTGASGAGQNQGANAPGPESTAQVGSAEEAIGLDWVAEQLGLTHASDRPDTWRELETDDKTQSQTGIDSEAESGTEPPSAEMTEAPAQTGVAGTIVLTIGFLVFMLTIGRWLCHRALPYVQAHWSWPGGTLVFVLTIGLICAAFTTWLGIHSIFGAFVAGIAIGDSHHLTERTRDTIHQFIINIFAPVFFASIGLRINFVERFDLLAVAVVFVVACIGKISGCFLGAKAARMSTREAGAVGFGMVAQGAVGIILGQLASQAGLISQELLVAIVIMAVGTSLLAGPAMQRILRTQTKRDLIDLLTDRHVLSDPKTHTAEGVIGELADRAGELTNLDSPTIAGAAIERERIMHTGMAGGLAVPHARLDDLNRPLVVIARHRDGINFDASDGQLARIICLILTSTERPEDQIELLSLIAGTFDSPEITQRLMRAETPTEFRAALNLARSEGQSSQA